MAYRSLKIVQIYSLLNILTIMRYIPLFLTFHLAFQFLLKKIFFNHFYQLHVFILSSKKCLLSIRYVTGTLLGTCYITVNKIGKKILLLVKRISNCTFEIVSIFPHCNYESLCVYSYFLRIYSYKCFYCIKNINILKCFF